MKSIYPQKFAYNFPTQKDIDAQIIVWNRQLQGFSEQVIQRALNECPRKFPKWMPEIGEFRELCMSFRGRENLKFHQSKEPRKKYVPISLLVEQGAMICARLMKIFPEVQRYEISVLFTKLKKIMRENYKNLDDLTIIEKLKNFSDQDLQELLA